MILAFLLVTLILLGVFLSKKPIFKILNGFVLIFVSLISFTLSQRYMKSKAAAYRMNDKSYSDIFENSELVINSQAKFPLLTIEESNAPKKIKAIGYLESSCNSTDTIVSVQVQGRVMKARYWFLQKSNLAESKLILKE